AEDCAVRPDTEREHDHYGRRETGRPQQRADGRRHRHPNYRRGVSWSVEPRFRKLNGAPPRNGGTHVLYWMRWNRRASANHALAFAQQTAMRLRVPLLVHESEDLGSERQRQFARVGAVENAAAFGKAGIAYVSGNSP